MYQPKRLIIFFGLLLLPLFGMTITGIRAQNSDTILTLAIPEWWQSGYEVQFEEILAEFEAANPGVKVVLKFNNGLYYYLGGETEGDMISSYLNSAEQFANFADVAYVTTSSLAPEATRAGYFLDLAPLTSGDAALNADDFQPAAWSAFQWDRGVWSIPAAYTPLIVNYNPEKFDAAGLSYPNELWTINDYANAIQTLAVYDEDGKIAIPGMIMFGQQLYTLLYSFINTSVYDSATVPNTPLFDVPGLADTLTTWSVVQASGALDFPEGNFDWEALPMRIDSTQSLGTSFGETEWSGALLPGGIAGMEVHGFSVSAGTAAPEAAYALANFLSTRGELMQFFWGSTPARQSIVGTYDDPSANFLDFTAEEQALIDQALTVMVSPAELRFYSYIEQALVLMRGSDDAPGVDAQTALAEAQAMANTNLQAADTRRTQTVVAVPTPVPTPILGAGEVALNFNVQSNVSPMPEREAWDAVIAEFVANDPEVRQVTLSTDFGGDPQVMAGNDCMYVSSNTVQSIDLTTILNLDPFMAADPNFTPDDYFAGIMPQVQREDRTWAYPLALFPEVLWYNGDLFQQAGAIAPELGGWTVDQFADAVRSLRLAPDDDAPFVPNSGGNTYILALAAGFGGLPLDFRTNPPTRNFTDPATVDALRQVLDLARGGYIKYTKLDENNFGGGGGWGPDMQIPIFTDILQSYSLAFSDFEGSPVSADSSYRITTYPSGSTYTPLVYTLGVSYISASTQHPEACYRFISTLSQHPELFSGMPARRSLLDSPLLLESQSDKLIEYYRSFDQLLSAPNGIVLPPAFFGDINAPGYFFWQMWLNRAMDNYVLENGDLEADLARAEENSRLIDECLVGIPQFDPSWTDEQIEAYSNQFRDCALSIDPEMAEFFGPVGDDEE